MSVPIQEHESQVYQEDESSDTANQLEIKSKIAHSSIELQKLSIDDNSFFAKIKQYNDISVNFIEQGKHKEALMYLQEAERMLEYGAMRGKTIDRNLILCVLNNQAVGYQKEWVIDKTAKYIQALIYNLQTSIEDDNIPFQVLYAVEGGSKQDQALNLSIIKRKNMLVKYYLIYCALLSQLKQNQAALQNSFKALLLLKQMFSGYSKYYKSNAFRQKDERMFTAKKLRLLKQLSNYNENLDVANYDILFKRVQYILKQWRQGKSQIKPDDKIQTQIKDFSIAKVMQPGPQTYTDFDKKLDFGDEITMVSLIKKVLLFVINFFSIATQIRLIDSHKHTSPQQKMKSHQFKRSQLYHLTAIKVFCTYVPYQSILVKHIQTSYANHYKFQLNVQNIQYVQDDQFLDEKKKSIIDSQKNRNVITSYKQGDDDDDQEDVIKPVEKLIKKKKLVPTLQIPKSPKAMDSKKLSTTKKKTPRKLVSPPLLTTKRSKDNLTTGTPRLSTKHLSSHKHLKTQLIQKQKKRDTSKSKKKSKIQREKSQIKIKKKSKSVNKQKIKPVDHSKEHSKRK